MTVLSDFGRHEIIISPRGFSSWTDLNNYIAKIWVAGYEVKAVKMTEGLFKRVMGRNV